MGELHCGSVLMREVVFESAWEGRTSAVTNLQRIIIIISSSSSSTVGCIVHAVAAETSSLTHLHWSGTSFYTTTAMSYADDYFCNWPTPDNAGLSVLHTYNTPGKHVSLTCSVKCATYL